MRRRDRGARRLRLMRVVRSARRAGDRADGQAGRAGGLERLRGDRLEAGRGPGPAGRAAAVRGAPRSGSRRRGDARDGARRGRRRARSALCTRRPYNRPPPSTRVGRSRLLPPMATSAGTPEHPLRVAIVGSGPSGFYAAGHLLNAKEVTAEVDMFDLLPTPFGLVRAGVAPDHPKIKSVTRVYEKTAAKPGFRFFGNVVIGEDVTHAELKERYHAVIYAVGAQTDRSMGIPGEDLPGSWAATEFVAWYNGHPDFRDLRVRPLLQARGCDRQRERGDGRGADARVAARGAGGHRHRRPCDRPDGRQRHRGGRDHRPPRARPRQRSPTPSCSSSAS